MLSEILRTTAARSNQRACFLLHVKPEKLEEYLEVHQHVWPEMLKRLSDTGWKNYSLFVEAATGMVVGYFESDDVAAAVENMSKTDIDATWQAEMAQYFAPPTNGSAAFLDQYFYLP